MLALAITVLIELPRYWHRIGRKNRTRRRISTWARKSAYLDRGSNALFVGKIDGNWGRPLPADNVAGTHWPFPSYVYPANNFCCECHWVRIKTIGAIDADIWTITDSTFLGARSLARHTGGDRYHE